ERLTQELGLSSEQQARLQAILDDTREKIRALGVEDPAERRRQAERLRAESRTRIAEILDPAQRARYEQMTAARAGRAATAGRVWVLDDRGKPKPVAVRLGLTDGTFSELVAGELQEGTQVIVGVRGDTKAKAPAGGPRFGF
ncbi:MAG TPA: hypothetical protein VNK67_07060, partial [Burkholderiales bacterium]|nr:hypothetical protein [Burkholderiales bacterium]